MLFEFIPFPDYLRGDIYDLQYWHLDIGATEPRHVPAFSGPDPFTIDDLYDITHNDPGDADHWDYEIPPAGQTFSADLNISFIIQSNPQPKAAVGITEHGVDVAFQLVTSIGPGGFYGNVPPRLNTISEHGIDIRGYIGMLTFRDITINSELAGDLPPRTSLASMVLDVDPIRPPPPAVYLSGFTINADTNIICYANLLDMFPDVDSIATPPARVMLSGMFIHVFEWEPHDLAINDVLTDADYAPIDTTDLRIFYGGWNQTNPWIERETTITEEQTVFLRGYRVGNAVDAECWSLLTADHDPYELGTPQSVEDWLYWYQNQMYSIGEGNYGEGPHAYSFIYRLRRWLWTSWTNHLDHRFTPQTPHDYEPGSGDPVAGFSIVSQTPSEDMVSFALPYIPMTVGNNYLLLRLTDPAGDYDTIVWRLQGLDQIMPRLRREPPPMTYDEAMDSPWQFQLADTAPKPGLPDPLTDPVRPRFSIGHTEPADDEWFCSYIKAGNDKVLYFSMISGKYGLYQGDLAFADDPSEPGVRWRIDDEPWCMDSMAFNPVIAYATGITTITDGTWTGTLPYHPQYREGLAGGLGEAATFVINVPAAMSDMISAGDHTITVAATDTEGNVQHTCMQLTKQTFTDTSMVHFVPHSSEHIKVDPVSGNMYTRGELDDIDVSFTATHSPPTTPAVWHDPFSAPPVPPLIPIRGSVCTVATRDPIVGHTETGIIPSTPTLMLDTLVTICRSTLPERTRPMFLLQFYDLGLIEPGMPLESEDLAATLYPNPDINQDVLEHALNTGTVSAFLIDYDNEHGTVASSADVVADGAALKLQYVAPLRHNHQYHLVLLTMSYDTLAEIETDGNLNLTHEELEALYPGRIVVASQNIRTTLYNKEIYEIGATRI